MNRINEYNMEPGVYADEAGNMLVVVDMITHTCPQLGHVHHLMDPQVVTRPLENLTQHERTTYPYSLFKEKFAKV